MNVSVDSGYVTTLVEQVFANPHPQHLEAIYTFPVPEKAALGEFTYWIDGTNLIETPCRVHCFSMRMPA